jgi:hypothetical protein
MLSSRTRCVSWNVLIVIAAIVAAPAAASGQETAAAVYGRVVDPAGAPVAGVAVTARSADLIRTTRVVTTSGGRYAFSTLPPGAYVIAFAREGYVPVQRTLTLAAGESVLVHIVLHSDKGSPAVAVDRDRPVFPPSWATTLESRYTSFDVLPVSGTLRTPIALVVDAATVRPGDGLFLLDGLPLRHGWGFTPALSFVGPGPETLQEATILPGRLTADYGRTQANTLAGVTASGTNRWAAGFRTTLGAADLNRDIPSLARETEDAAASAEVTVGGPIVRDRVWLFASGRHLTQTVPNLTAFDSATFLTDTREDFGVAKLTIALGSSQRLEGQWLGARQRLTGAPAANAFLIGDAGALEHRELTNNSWSGAYIGTYGGRVQFAARYTREEGTDRADEAVTAASLSARTPLIDQATGIRWWASGACAACDPREATNETVRATLGIAAGPHYFTLGGDVARDEIRNASTPAGGAFEVRASRTDLLAGVTVPVFAPNGSTWIVWQPEGASGQQVRGDAVFLQDRWTVASRLQIDWGVRFDRSRVRATPGGALLLSEQLVSPRVFLSWRPSAERPWTFDAGFGRYGIDPTDRVSPFAGASTRVFTYGGPPVNVNAPTLSSAAALDLLFASFQAAGGTSRAPLFAFEPGLSLQVTGERSAPRVDEWSAGLSRMLGEGGYARADVAVRKYGDLGAFAIDRSAVAIDQFGRRLDVSNPIDSSLLERQYVNFSLRGRYRFGHYADIHAQYAWSRLTGNADETRFGVNPLTPGALAYREYFESSWHLPSGRLPDDVPHQFRLWAHSEVMANDKYGMVIVTAVFNRESGRPYGAVAPVAVAGFASNPADLQPPVALDYYFTDRDAFRTDPLKRTDMGLSWRRSLFGTVHGDLFVNLHILNVFGATQVLNPQQYVVTRTAYTDATLQPFNPFTATPVRDVNWTFDDSGVRPDEERPGVPTTLGRTWLVTLGVRF